MRLLWLYYKLPLSTPKICMLAVLLGSFLCAGCTTHSKARKDKASAMEDMGRSIVLQGNPRGGLAYLLDAAKLDPDNPDIEHELALVYGELEENDLALQHFKKAIGLRHDFPEAVNNMGALYSKMKQWDKALECFQLAVSDILYKTPHFAYRNMGLVYFYKGDYPVAIEKFQKALKLAPSYTPALYDLASAFIALNRFEDAVESYKKAATLNPQSRQASLNLARLYIKMNRRQEALDELKKIIELDPRSQAAKEANQLLEELSKK
jgi:type IV pilus assembly protein PilF